MIIQNNLVALNLSNQMNTTNKLKTNVSEKLSSGYKINKAADGAADLNISESMRAKIRGLNQASQNVQDASSYLQTGDGAMNEITDMLHRMKELAIRSINGTISDQDRAALAAEMDELQSEIDGIFKKTVFNDTSVFEEHRDNYYSVVGNVHHTPAQKHLITSGDAASLKIRSGTDEYLLTVPEGIYTTQELMDELDDIICRDYPDSSLYLTYTEDGTVNANFEDGREIDAVGGGLAYLIYGTEPQKTEGLLIGVSDFSGGGILDIIPNKNDRLIFYVGNSETPIDITVPPGSYDRDTLVGILNQKLTGSGVTAQKYKDGFISLYSPSKVISGLAGNMIKCDNITSILYDISTYGETVNKSGYVIGGVPMDETVNGQRLAGVEIKSGVNDILKFQLDGNTTKTYQINLLTGKVSEDGLTWSTYGTAAAETSPHRYNSVAELARRINDICDAKDENADGKKIGLKASIIYGTTGIISYMGSQTSSFLKLESTKLSNDSKVVMIADDAVSKECYRNIFTEIEYEAKAKYTAGSNESIRGNAFLNANATNPIVIDDTNNIFTIKQERSVNSITRTDEYRITLPKKNYKSPSELMDEINAQIQSYSNPLDPSDKIYLSCGLQSVNNAGLSLTLTATNSSVTKISFPKIDTEKGAHQLWRGDTPKSFYPNIHGTGTEGIVGSYKPAVCVGNVVLPDRITIDFTNNKFNYVANNTYEELYFKPGTYTREQFIRMLNEQKTTNGTNPLITFQLTADNKLQMSTIMKGSEAYLGTQYGTGLEWISGETNNSTPVSSHGNVNSIQGQKIPAFPLTINSANNSFKFTYNTSSPLMPDTVNRKQYTLQIADGTYASLADLTAATNEALKHVTLSGGSIEDISGIFAATANGKGGITITGPSGASVVEGSNTYPPFEITAPAGGFYDKVLCQKTVDKVTTNYPGYPALGKLSGVDWSAEGEYQVTPAYIVGRLPIKGENVTIKGGINDRLTLNLTMQGSNGSTIPLKMQLTPGEYDNKSLIKEIQTQLNKTLLDKGLITSLPVDDPATPEDESIRDSLIRTGVDVVHTENVPPNIGAGAISNEKQLYFYYNGDSSVANKDKLISGTYILDAVRGSAAYSLFYKTEGEPSAVYVVGAEDLSKGVSVRANNNKFQMDIDGVPVNLTLDEGNYSAADFIAMFNRKLEEQNIPVKASLHDGKLRMDHKNLDDTHTIDSITGSGKIFFYHEEGRLDDINIRFHIGNSAQDYTTFKKSNMSTTLLGINSITVSKVKYAKKALERLDAALAICSSERSRFGTVTNRMEYTKNGNDSTEENLTAAESSIRDTNIAKSIVENSKLQILQKAQQALCAQTKQISQTALLLLN